MTEQMVANFARGGAAINQIAKLAGASLRVVPIELDRPTRDFTVAAAMDADEFRALGHELVDLLSKYLEGVESMPVSPQAEPEMINQLFREPLPEEPTSPDAVVAELERREGTSGIEEKALRKAQAREASND